MARMLRRTALPVLLATATALAGCATVKPPEISYDSSVPPLPAPPAPIVEERPQPLHTPPAWTPSRGGSAARQPTARVQNANAAARVEPRREGYYNAIQVYPWSERALYQVYAAPGQITTIAPEPGERLTGAGPIAAGDTPRRILGDTNSSSATTPRVHILVTPTRPATMPTLLVTPTRPNYTIDHPPAEDLYSPTLPHNGN